MTAARPAEAVPPAPAGDRPTACLLHGEFHVMGADCWDVTLDFYCARPHLTDAERRDDYQAAVERKMLNHLARERLHRG